MNVISSDRGRAPLLTTLMTMALCGCASTAGGPRGTGDIGRIKKVAASGASEDSAVASTASVQVFRQSSDSLLVARVPFAAVQHLILAEGDSLVLAPMWRMRLRLTTAPAGWDWVALSPELMTARGDGVPGRQLGGTAGLYSIGTREGRIVLDVHQGAVVLNDWGANTSEGICVRAAGMCAVGIDGASFAIQVDAEGTANLYVESGAVNLASESLFLSCRAANAPPDVACGIATPEPVSPGSAWRWRPGGIPTQDEVTSEDRKRWEDIIGYNGKDLWREGSVRRWAPWLLVPVAVVTCLATDFWICGDDSITGTVVVVGG